MNKTPNITNLPQKSHIELTSESESSDESIADEKLSCMTPKKTIVNLKSFKNTTSDSDISSNLSKNQVALKASGKEPTKLKKTLMSAKFFDDSSFSGTDLTEKVLSNPKILKQTNSIVKINQNKKPLTAQLPNLYNNNVGPNKYEITAKASPRVGLQQALTSTKLKIPIIKMQATNNKTKLSNTLTTEKNIESNKMDTSRSKIIKTDRNGSTYPKKLAEKDTLSSGSDSQLEEEVNDMLAIIDFNRRTSIKGNQDCAETKPHVIAGTEKLIEKQPQKLKKNSSSSFESSSTEDETDKKPLNQPWNDAKSTLVALETKNDDIFVSSSHENSDNDIQKSKLPKSQIFTSKIYKKMKQNIASTSFNEQQDLKKISSDQKFGPDSSDSEFSDNKLPISIVPSINNKKKHITELTIDVPSAEKISPNHHSASTKRKLHDRNVISHSNSSMEDSDSSSILDLQSPNHFDEKIHKGDHDKIEVSKTSSKEAIQKELNNQVYSTNQSFFSPKKVVSNFTESSINSASTTKKCERNYNDNLPKNFNTKHVSDKEREAITVVTEHPHRSTKFCEPIDFIHDSAQSKSISKSLATQTLLSQKSSSTPIELDNKSIKNINESDTPLRDSTSFDSNDLNKPEKLMFRRKKGIKDTKESQNASNFVTTTNYLYDPAKNQANKRKNKGKGQEKYAKKTNKLSQEMSGRHTSVSTPVSVANFCTSGVDLIPDVIEVLHNQ
ncbi:hypothetical protein MXB_1499 [Myxobolus squamalis]|nr:hypothetical protein MXB_1499 [Myxobolus squamalis]